MWHERMLYFKAKKTGIHDNDHDNDNDEDDDDHDDENDIFSVKNK